MKSAIYYSATLIKSWKGKRYSMTSPPSDIYTYKVVAPGTAGWRKIKQQFGDAVLLEGGSIDRTKLGQIIFADEEKRRLLNSITHPEIYKAILWKLLGLLVKGHQFAVLDLPLLFESKKMVPYMSCTVVVSCTKDQQLQRLMLRNSFTQEEAEQRINAQMSLDEKCKRATDIIDNSGELQSTEQQVKELCQKLQASRAHWKVRVIFISIFVASLSTIIYLVS